MNIDRCASGKRVRVTNESPFRGLKGTIHRVHMIDDEETDPFCFYLVTLDVLRVPLWFEHSEIEFVDALPVPVKACQELGNAGRQKQVQKEHAGLDVRPA